MPELRRPLLLPLLLDLLLHACSAPPSAVALPPPPPPCWSAAAGVQGPNLALEADWWRSFGDPILDSLVEEALEHNQDLAAAAARIAQADAQYRAAVGGKLPQLSLDGSSGRSRTNLFGFPFPGLKNGVLPIITESDRLGLSASWEPDLWGRLGNRERSALAEVEATAADAAGVRLALVGRVVQDYFALQTSSLQVETARALLRNASDQAEALQTRFLQGSSEAPALLAAHASLSSSQAALSATQDQRESLSRGFEVLLGRFPAGAFAPDHGLPELPSPVPAGLPAELLGRRPDLAAASARIRSAAALADAAQGDLLPRISLSASGGSSSDALKDLLNGDFQVWSFATSLSAPLFQGGRLRGARDAAAAARDQLRTTFAAQSLVAFAEVENALSSEAWLRTRGTQLASMEASSRASAEAWERRLSAGSGDALSLLTARATLLRATLSATTAQEQLLQNRVRLILALGGGFHDPSAESTE